MRRGIASSSRFCNRALKRWTVGLELNPDSSTDCSACRAFVPSAGAFSKPVGACAGRDSDHDHAMVCAGHSCERFARQSRPPQYESRRFFTAVHKRWARHVRSQPGDVEGRPQGHQCGTCAFYIPLDGAFIEDWGTCANPKSRRDGEPVFEHDGCAQFEANLLEWGGPIPKAALLRKGPGR